MYVRGPVLVGPEVSLVTRGKACNPLKSLHELRNYSRVCMSLGTAEHRGLPINSTPYSVPRAFDPDEVLHVYGVWSSAF